MDNAPHTSFNASDRSYLAILKKDMRAKISEAGFEPKRQAEIDIIISEIASNMVKHAKEGEILIRIFTEDDSEVVELIGIDKGPGMHDVDKMIMDGVSTTKTLGQGLGAIKRLSDVFEIYSQKDWGTILLSRIYKSPLPIHKKKPFSETRSIVLAKPGETVSGDSFFVKAKGRSLQIFLGDGLGHGPEANNAINEAVKAFRICPDNSPVDIIRFINVAVKKTRGLVGTVAIFEPKEMKWMMCGVGNIASRIHNSFQGKTFLPYNGIIGMNIPTTMNEQQLAHEHGQVLVMCSDGIKTRWEGQKYPTIFKYDLSIFAAALYKDFARKTDDMSIVVSRIN